MKVITSIGAVGMWTAVLCSWGAGCGGGSSGTMGSDGGVDADAPMGDGGQQDRGPAAMCPDPAPGETRGLGACCRTDAHCGSGLCWNGYCSKTCGSDGDCGAATSPSPFAGATTLRCATNMLGVKFNLCLAGSLKPCDGKSDGCDAGEGCALGVDPSTKTPGGGLRGQCMALLNVDHRAAAGAECDPAHGPYECADQGGYLGNACVSRRCTHSCTPGDDSSCPGDMTCVGGLVFPLGDPGPGKPFLAGHGICLGRTCGLVRELGSGATAPARMMGADSQCDAGRICAASVVTGPDRVTLSCSPPQPAAAAFGAACDPANPGTTCADPSLCADPAAVGLAGAAFCSQSCRRDGDCPTDAICVEYPVRLLPNASRALLGMCTPKARVTATLCKAEGDCGAGQSCRRLGDRTMTHVCGLYGGQDAAGATCTTDATCAAPSRCVFQDGAGRCTDVTKWKALGDACNGPGECRSGECRDQKLLTVMGGKSKAFCVAPCQKNSDCGGPTRCFRTVFSNNETPMDPTDDTLYGFCTPLTPQKAEDACTTDEACKAKGTGADTCDVPTGACYKKGAVTGAKCTMDAECGLGGQCLLGARFKDGYCSQFGCAPGATTGVDSCPGADAVCAQRAQDDPIWSCYEGCATDLQCDRYSEQYRCDSPKTGEPKSICLYSGSGT